MILEPVEIDLRGMSLEEVVQFLKSKGFAARTYDFTKEWNNHRRCWTGKMVNLPQVQIVCIAEKEAPLLTVTIFNGKRITLESHHDLHLFDRSAGQPRGQDWAVVHTLNILR